MLRCSAAVLSVSCKFCAAANSLWRALVQVGWMPFLDTRDEPLKIRDASPHGSTKFPVRASEFPVSSQICWPFGALVPHKSEQFQ